VLDMVCRLLGWDAPVFGGRICAGAILPGELDVGEFVLFVFNLPSRLVLPIFPFFRWSAWPRGAALFHRCLASRMFISLAVVESELGCGSVFHMSW
jgi:hypothetical protein